MATCVTLTYETALGEAGHILTVEVSCDNDPHPDLLDSLSRRSIYLLNEAAAALKAVVGDD